MKVDLKRGLTDRQIALIELLVGKDISIVQACEAVQVPRSTYYSWKRDSKAFNEAMDEAIEEKVAEAKKNIRASVNKYIDRLDKLSATGKNEAARVNAISKLFTLAELDPQFKQEVTVKNDDSDSKNIMLDMLKKKREEKQE